jgi:hypothetical protein
MPAREKRSTSSDVNSDTVITSALALANSTKDDASARPLRRFVSAITAIRCDPQSRAYYQRKRDEGLYALIRDNRTWQPDSPPITTAAA